MKHDLQLEKKDIAIDGDIQLSDDNPQEITAYIETWFDVDKKFMVDTTDDGTWVNMYGKYNPFVDSLEIECVISSDNDSQCFKYNPTKQESDLIKQMITDKIKQVYGQTPQEFCLDAQEQSQQEEITMGGM